MIISKFRDKLAQLLTKNAAVYVKRKVYGVTKPYWPDALSKLKRLAVEAHVAWNVNGRLRHVILNDSLLLCETCYKRALRCACDNFVHSVNEILVIKLMQHNQNRFEPRGMLSLVSFKIQILILEGYSDAGVIA